jgi:hypothetical protein
LHEPQFFGSVAVVAHKACPPSGVHSVPDVHVAEQ